jgi:hypothetical protein
MVAEIAIIVTKIIHNYGSPKISTAEPVPWLRHPSKIPSKILRIWSQLGLWTAHCAITSEVSFYNGEGIGEGRGPLVVKKKERAYG